MVNITNDIGTISITSEVFTNLAGDAATSCFGVKGMVACSKEGGPWQLLHRLPAQDAHGPSCLGLGDVAAAILPEAGNGYEHVAGAYPL